MRAGVDATTLAVPAVTVALRRETPQPLLDALHAICARPTTSTDQLQQLIDALPERTDILVDVAVNITRQLVARHRQLAQTDPRNAKLYTKRVPAGIPLPAAELFSPRGVLVGCDGMTGDVTGEDDCRGEVRFEFVADQPGFTVTQRAAERGSKQYEYTPRAAGGRTGHQDQVQEHRHDATGRRHHQVRIAGRTRVRPGYYGGIEPTTGLEWQHIDNDGVVRRGVNLGSFAPGAALYLRLTVRVTEAASPRCGINRVAGTATAETHNRSKSHELTVETERAC